MAVFPPSGPFASPPRQLARAHRRGGTLGRRGDPVRWTISWNAPARTPAAASTFRSMLSYRHMFHAGNFADVFKHALLTRLLIALSARTSLTLSRHPRRHRAIRPHARVGAESARIRERHRAALERDDLPAELEPYHGSGSSGQSAPHAALLSRARRSSRAASCAKPTAWCWSSSTRSTATS